MAFIMGFDRIQVPTAIGNIAVAKYLKLSLYAFPNFSSEVTNYSEKRGKIEVINAAGIRLNTSVNLTAAA